MNLWRLGKKRVDERSSDGSARLDAESGQLRWHSRPEKWLLLARLARCLAPRRRSLS